MIKGFINAIIGNVPILFIGVIFGNLPILLRPLTTLRTSWSLLEAQSLLLSCLFSVSCILLLFINPPEAPRAQTLRVRIPERPRPGAQEPINPITNLLSAQEQRAKA